MGLTLELLKLVIYLAVGILLGGMIFGDVVLNLQEKWIGVEKDQITSIEECEDRNLTNSANCLNKYVNKIYIYTKNSDSNELNLSELKSEGGDCLDWARFYRDTGKSLGFSGKIILINMGEIDHAITIISDNETYCIMDQQKYKCFKIDI